MRVDELCRPHLVALKQAYLIQLDNSGELEAVTGSDSLSWEELEKADEIVSDDRMLEHYAGVEFTTDDFTNPRRSRGIKTISGAELPPHNMKE